MQSTFIYEAAAYVRASKDDLGSSTIENQKELIRDFAKSRPEIHIVAEYEDNGFSGVDFLRPSFTEMMKDIEAGKINCVIIKDLSRLGRNYIEVGELMEDVLPRLNVRLIAVNDHYDSLNPRNDSDDIIIPFKNLMNEHYLRDFSVKIRSHLEVKRKNGDFVAAFAPYGYMRLSTDKHRLVIDEHAAGVVRDIFHRKLEGMSQQRIADHLNEIGEPSPAEYKKRDTKYVAKFQTHARASWSAVAVGRILRNPVYIGTLVQGKVTTPNYKVKKFIQKPEDEWSIFENAHEPIIEKKDYEIVSALLTQDTRTAPEKDTVYPLSGLIFCADCGNNVIRKKVGKYSYYICATAKAKNGCTFRYFRREKLEQAVMEAIAKQISYILDVEKSLEYLSSLPYQQRNVNKFHSQIADREKEIKDCERYKRSLHEDYTDGLLSKDDYIEFSKDYTERIEELQRAADKLRKETELLFNDGISSHKWIEQFKRYHNVTELSRQLAVNTIERIEVFEGKRLLIKFRYQDKLNFTQEVLNAFNVKEAGCL